MFLLFATHSAASVSPKIQLGCENTGSRLAQIHTNVTVNVQNIMCHCFSPPAPNKLLKTHFIHRVTVLAVYLINMTTQSTQDFFQFPSFAFSHFRQKEQKVTTVLYFFCQYTIIYISWFNQLTKIDSKPFVGVSAAVLTSLWDWKKNVKTQVEQVCVNEAMQTKIKHYVWNPWVIFPGALLKYFTLLCFSKSPDDITPQYSLVFSDLNGSTSKSSWSNYSSINLISRRYMGYKTSHA